MTLANSVFSCSGWKGKWGCWRKERSLTRECSVEDQTQKNNIVNITQYSDLYLVKGNSWMKNEKPRNWSCVTLDEPFVPTLPSASSSFTMKQVSLSAEPNVRLETVSRRKGDVMTYKKLNKDIFVCSNDNFKIVTVSISDGYWIFYEYFYRTNDLY